MTDQPVRLPKVPLRLGFFLEKPGQRCWGWELPYRGVDRMYFGPSLEEDDDYRRSGRGRLADAWDAYWEAEESKALHTQRETAQRLQTEFRAEGLVLDLVYAEAAVLPIDFRPDDRDLWTVDLMWALDTHQQIPSRPPGLRLLGFDLSDPAPTFHSAIAQPGIYEAHPEAGSLLNSNGLFDRTTDAEKYLRFVNEHGSGGRIFCVISVWEVAQIHVDGTGASGET